jgi:hypothetical protein
MSPLTKSYKVRIDGHQIKLFVDVAVEVSAFFHFDKPEAVKPRRILIYIGILVNHAGRNANDTASWNGGAIRKNEILKRVSAHQHLINAVRMVL